MSVEYIKTSLIYEGFQSLLPDRSEEELTEITATLTLLMATGLVDRKFDKREVSYLKHYARQHFHIYGDVLKKIVELLLMSARNAHSFKSILNHIESYVENDLSKTKKLRLIETMFCMTSSDADISRSEKKFLKNFTEGIGLDTRDYTEELLTASLKMVTQISEEIKEHEELQTDENEMKIIGSSEFYEDYLKSLK